MADQFTGTILSADSSCLVRLVPRLAPQPVGPQHGRLWPQVALLLYVRPVAPLLVFRRGRGVRLLYPRRLARRAQVAFRQVVRVQAAGPSL